MIAAARSKLPSFVIPYLQVGFPRALRSGDVVPTWRVLEYWLRIISCARRVSATVRRMSLQTACTMRVPVLGMSSSNLGLVTTGSSDRGLHRTRTQCPAVLTRPLADPHSHADLTAGRHGESHRGFRLSIVNWSPLTILILTEKDE